MRRLLVLMLRFYKRFISPFLPPACRFTPTCSEYAMEAVMVHGTVRGSTMAVLRLLRCHPFHAGGHDPVPPRRLSGPHTERQGDR
jgi:hypothetical protein